MRPGQRHHVRAVLDTVVHLFYFPQRQRVVVVPMDVNDIPGIGGAFPLHDQAHRSAHVEIVFRRKHAFERLLVVFPVGLHDRLQQFGAGIDNKARNDAVKRNDALKAVTERQFLPVLRTGNENDLFRRKEFAHFHAQHAAQRHTHEDERPRGIDLLRQLAGKAFHRCLFGRSGVQDVMRLEARVDLQRIEQALVRPLPVQKINRGKLLLREAGKRNK